MKQVAAIILAGGTGQRAGPGLAKQWQPLLGKRVIDWSVSAFCSHSRIGEIVIVAARPPEGLPDDPRIRWAMAGTTRTRSVLSGLEAVRLEEDAIVLVHDAARPGIDHETIDSLIACLDDPSVTAAAPAVTVTDALKSGKDGTWKTIDRTGLVRVQTPQAFRLGDIRQALAMAGPDLVDDLAAIEPLGGTIRMVPGKARLSKITHAEDFEMLARLMTPTGAPRIGKGFDVHAFEPGERVILCGVHIAHTARLQGHSDADVAWHALTDAILGALALGDIGDHFPPSDPAWKDRDSAVFLAHAARLAGEQGYMVSNCDLTLICEEPKIKPHREAMCRSTATLLGIAQTQVSVKATTTEGLGFTGRREGIAAEAVVLLSPRP